MPEVLSHYHYFPKDSPLNMFLIAREQPQEALMPDCFCLFMELPLALHESPAFTDQEQGTDARFCAVSSKRRAEP